MKIFWRIYFAVLSIQVVGNFVSIFAIGSPIYPVLDIVNWFFIVLAYLGVLGFILNKVIISPVFYKLFTPVLIGWDVFYLFWWSPTVFGYSINIFVVSVAAVAVPQYFALFRYAYSLAPEERHA
ncbi:hypothetical protein [Microbulbifer aggregans]|uniref:hypothetical protein n=1 Tax=Microbulbifer aggregans TaxID=1769779 RepID=UPI001CFF3CCA|nr:hypothetical protein [Microbulbifer aggregans]